MTPASPDSNVTACVAFGPATYHTRPDNHSPGHIRMRSFTTILTTGILLAFCANASALQATDDGAAGEPDPATEAPPLNTNQGGGPSLDQAVEQVRRQYQGRIVGAETRRRGNCELHIIRVLTPDGTVKTVEIRGRCN